MATPQRRAVFITALAIERTAVLEHLRDVNEELPLRGSIYRMGIFNERSDPWEVVVAEIGAGNEGAAAEAERVIAHYAPEVALFVGVAGAIKDLKHGDVVASTKVYNYGAGKDRKTHFETRPDTELPAYSLLARARHEAGEPDWHARIRALGEVSGMSVRPQAKVGPIAAGPKVLASNRTETFKFIRDHYGDAVAVEMEGHGFLLGVRMNHPTQGLVVRGISDRISDKNPASDDDWQPVAARHAAAFAFQILAKLTNAPSLANSGLQPASLSSLPSLTERIENGLAGEIEFKRLLHCLLMHDGRKNHYLYEPVDDLGGSLGGIDGIVRQGDFLGLEPPVGLYFAWSTGEQNVDDHWQQEVTVALGRVQEALPELKNWVIVTPRELTGSNRRWLEESGKGKAFGVHLADPRTIEVWLRQQPALLARYYPNVACQHPQARGFQGGDFKTWAQQYREKVTAAYRILRLLGLPPRVVQHQDEAGSIPLRKIFVPQTFTPWGQRGGLARPLTELCQSNRPCVLLGDPGSGKSTVLHFLSLAHLGAAELAPDTGAGRLPLLIPLGAFVRRQRQQDRFDFLDALDDSARSAFQMRHSHPFFFESLLLMGEAIVLLDGLDEVGNTATRSQVARAIEAFYQEYPRCPLWVTSRIVGYSGSTRLDAERFDHFLVGRFDEEQRKTFITKWYEAQLPNDSRTRTERTQLLTVAVERNPGVRRLASNPLLLTLMTLIHHYHGRLPQSRGELYDMCVDMLLEHWQVVKTPDEPHPLRERGLHTDDAKKYLAALALWIQERNELQVDEDARGLVPERDLVARLVEIRLRARRDRNESAARDDVRVFLDYIRERTGLLVYRGEVEGQGLFSFAHLSFQEYLAAYQLAEDRSRTTQTHLQFFLEHVGRPAWEECLLLMLYRLSRSTGDESFLDLLVNAVVRHDEETRKPRKFFRKKTTLTTPAEREACWLLLGRALRDDLDFTERDSGEILTRLLNSWCQNPSLSGNYFQVLDEIALFSTRMRAPLAEHLERGWSQGPPEQAVAYLHLHARLLGLPAEASQKLGERADLPRLVPDLVVFHQEPGMGELLGSCATLSQWESTFQLLDCPAFYANTLEWAKAAGRLDECPAHLLAAAALLFRKTGEELASRSRYAAGHRNSDLTFLFERFGSERVEQPHYTAALPLASFRAHQVEGSPQGTAPAPVSPSLLERHFEVMRRGPTPESALVAWVGNFLGKGLTASGRPAEHVVTCVSSHATRIARHFLRAFASTVAKNDTEEVSVQIGSYLYSPSIDWGSIGKIYRALRKIDRYGPNFPGTEEDIYEISRDLLRDFVRDFADGCGDDTRRDFVSVKPTLPSRDFTVLHDYWGGVLRDDYWGRVLRGTESIAGLDRDSTLRKHHYAALRLLRHRKKVAELERERESVAPTEPSVQEELDSNRQCIDPGFLDKYMGASNQDLIADSGTDTLLATVGNPLALPLVLVELLGISYRNYMVTLGRQLALKDPKSTPKGACKELICHHPLDVYGVALAWEEHCKEFAAHHSRLEGPPGVLLLAHAAYASLMTGLACKDTTWQWLLSTRSPGDPLLEFGYLLYELCCFRESAANIRRLNALLTSCPAACSPVLEAAGWLLDGRPRIRFLDGT